MAREGSLFRVRIGCEPHYSAQQFLVGITSSMWTRLTESSPSCSRSTSRTSPTLGDSSRPCNYGHPGRRRVGHDFQGRAIRCRPRVGQRPRDQRCRRVHLPQGARTGRQELRSPARELPELRICSRVLHRERDRQTYRGGRVPEAPRRGRANRDGGLPRQLTVDYEHLHLLRRFLRNLRALRSYERPADHAGSRFQASIDPDECTLCETCLERCQIEALVEGDECVEVDRARCIGCGLCVTTCPVEAIPSSRKPSHLLRPRTFSICRCGSPKKRGLQ